MVRPNGEERKQLPIAEVKPDSWGSRSETSNEGPVTLTQSQLEQLLSAIKIQNTAINRNSLISCSENASKKLSDSENHESYNHEAQPTENINPSKISDENISLLKVPCPLNVLVPPSSLNSSALHTELSQNKLSPLSKLEQKRRQWEKERAEMIEWNPWGKPGAGAPVKKTQYVAPLTPRTNNQLLMVQTSVAMPYSGAIPANIPSCLPSPNPNRMISSIEQSYLPGQNAMNYSNTMPPIKPVPPVFKSSIAFGNTDTESVASDFYKRQQWYKEFDYQREEQRRIQQDQNQLCQVSDPKWVTYSRDEIDSISLAGESQTHPGTTNAEILKRNYTRGQGFHCDPISAAEAEQRRLRALQFQEEIRMQMEEKQRRLKEEKERIKREEEEEERRLAAERAQIQAEYEEEQMRLKQKTELEERKHMAIVTAMRQAQAQAEMDKKSKKIHKLLPINNENKEDVNVSNSQKDEKREAPLVATDEPSFLSHNELKGDSDTQPKHTTDSCKIDEQAPNTEIKQRVIESTRELGVQTCSRSITKAQTESLEKCTECNAKYSGYTIDRVLTPSIFRIRAKQGHARDFGTQTENNYRRYVADDAESTESNTSSFHCPVSKRLTRLQYSKPYKAQRRPQCNENLHANERPKWGANQPSKSYVRMTERDPHFLKRKKMQELRRQHWERELAAQKISSRKAVTSSLCPSLRSRRALSSSDCTVGYSSSEFETKSCRQFRSNSTPRYQQASAVRSDGGSLENVAIKTLPIYPGTVARSILRRRDSQSSDNLPSIIGGSEPSPIRQYDTYPLQHYGSKSLPPMRRKWHSQETFYPSSNYRSFSPPRLLGTRPQLTNEPFSFDLPLSKCSQRRKWSDQESFDLESVVRSHAAQQSRPSSTESSEKSDAATVSSSGSIRGQTVVNQNPLVYPEVITGRPTPRQDRILQNLSSLRQGLLKKQKELENLIRRPPNCLS